MMDENRKIKESRKKREMENNKLKMAGGRNNIRNRQWSKKKNELKAYVNNQNISKKWY